MFLLTHVYIDDVLWTLMP